MTNLQKTAQAFGMDEHELLREMERCLGVEIDLINWDCYIDEFAEKF